MKNKKTILVLSAIAALAIVAVIIEALFLHSVNTKLKNTNLDLISTQQQLQTSENNFSAETAIDDRQIIANVGKLTPLPSGEQPTIATVADLSKLQGQPFFAQAQVGDQVLIYVTANKVIMYRPSDNKIIGTTTLSAIQTPAK